MSEELKDKLLSLAEGIGIKKAGFTENAFVALFPYYVRGEEGNISMYARGEDYHAVIERKLRIIADEILKLGGRVAEIHVDKGELNDRRAAFLAGLGFFGRNGMLICEEYGSYFFIGQIVHDLDVEPDKPLDLTCLGCGECERRCIGGAISKDGFNAEKCVSGISQKKGDLSENEKRLIAKSGLCWGCDVCQRVCPHNKGLDTTAIPEFLTNRIKSLNVSELEGISGREFKRKYKSCAFSWRGKDVLVRNLGILMAAREENNGEE